MLRGQAQFVLLLATDLPDEAAPQATARAATARTRTDLASAVPTPTAIVAAVMTARIWTLVGMRKILNTRSFPAGLSISGVGSVGGRVRPPWATRQGYCCGGWIGPALYGPAGVPRGFG